MKMRWVALFLALFLLCGCEAEQRAETAPSESTVPTLSETKPTEPVGFYEPDSTLEQATAGAVKAFPLGTENADGIRFLGEDLLLFCGTRLTLLTGESLYVKAEVQLPCPVSPTDPGVTVDAQGVTYVDISARELVFLDETLTETKRVGLPEGCGTAGFSADRKLLYYCTADAVRVLDLETGLDRLLKEMFFPFQDLVGLHCGDTVLQCSVTHDDGSQYTLFFSADTGALLYEAMEDMTLWTRNDFYFTIHMDGAYRELLSGSQDFGPSVLVTEQEPLGVEPVLCQQSLLLYTLSGNGAATKLDYYHLETGAHTAQVELPGEYYPTSTQPDPEEKTLWFLCFDAKAQQNILCAWELDQSATGDTAQYLQPRWDWENPDLEGLSQCSALAARISMKHDVQILIWTDATQFQPWDYTLVSEYQVPLIRDRLAKLDEILSCYPAGFLEEAASETGSGALSICLVRAIWGNADTGALDSAAGLQYWDQDANAYLAITPGQDMEQHIHHELFHIIDSRVLSSCAAYDNWNDLNPPNFHYDSDYASNLQRDDWELVSGEQRYFIDMYSMSFPKEDRARIMEYAMMPNQEDTFRSDPMQAKLRQLCLGIREAFHLEQEPVVYRWEQYLKTPLYERE